MAMRDVEFLEKRQGTARRGSFSRDFCRCALAAWPLAAAMLLPIPEAHAQPQPPPAPYIACPPDNQPLIKIPEIVARDHKLRGTIVLNNGPERLYLGNNSPDGKTKWCLEQNVRQFGGGTVVPDYPGVSPQFPPGAIPDPVPGPTLRAHVGDIVELTFLNQIVVGPFWTSVDRGERDEGCDPNPSVPYPGPDEFPDCFHGSSTGNIHFHGTHTSPRTTGDNVFIEVRPSSHESGQIVTEGSVNGSFGEFFKECEDELNKNVLSQWPRSWADLPSSWTAEQERLLKLYDANPAIKHKLWPIDEAQLKINAWPQYYIGAYPFCFRLPEYVERRLPAPPAHPVAHTAAAAEEARTLQMGQAPGTHWYHAHKHGSTTINVANGMTGVFIIEGQYDADLDRWYGQGWSRRQPVLVMNQLGTVPNLFSGSGGQAPFSVNGRLLPRLTMRPGEVQLWRIANTSSRGGVFFAGTAPEPPPSPASPLAWAPFQVKQIAQDGVQFTQANYDASKDRPFLMAAGNRVDLLVKAPDNQTGHPQVYAIKVRNAINKGQTQNGRLVTLMTVEVESGPTVAGHESEFIAGDNYPTFPPFLADIPAEAVKTTKTITFESAAPKGPVPANAPPYTIHTIDGKEFDGNVGQVVLLNTIEEWKIENRTFSGSPPGLIDHPFHIHINPFQVVEVFDPNKTVKNSANQIVPKYVFYSDPKPDPAQCYLDPFKPDTWRDCHNVTPPNIWWDVFPIPSGLGATGADKKPIIDPKSGTQIVVPGYFKMRSRFVDYSGQYVIHCHILAHEDRGMMTIVEVVPYTTPYTHR
jgi:FtsP/CotA-like multicopper oxidase with cupredoxin domain